MPSTLQTTNHMRGFMNAVYENVSLRYAHTLQTMSVVHNRSRRAITRMYSALQNTCMRIIATITIAMLRTQRAAQTLNHTIQHEILRVTNDPADVVHATVALIQDAIRGRYKHCDETTAISVITKLQHKYREYNVDYGDVDTIVLQHAQLHKEYSQLYEEGQAMLTTRRSVRHPSVTLFMNVHIIKQQSCLTETCIAAYNALSCRHATVFFGNLVNAMTVTDVCPDEIDTMYLLYNIINDRCMPISTKITDYLDYSLHPYIHFNESLQLLRALHIDISDNRQRIRMEPILQKYVSNYNELQTQYLLPLTDEHKAYRDILSTSEMHVDIIRITQMLIARGAMNDICEMTKQAFGAQHSDNIQDMSLWASTNGCIPTEISIARLIQAIQFCSLYEILLQYTVNTHKIVSRTEIQDAHNSIVALEAILNKLDAIVYRIVQNIQAQAYGELLYYMLHNGIEINDENLYAIRNHVDIVTILTTLSANTKRNALSARSVMQIITEETQITNGFILNTLVLQILNALLLPNTGLSAQIDQHIAQLLLFAYANEQLITQIPAVLMDTQSLRSNASNAIACNAHKLLIVNTVYDAICDDNSVLQRAHDVGVEAYRTLAFEHSLQLMNKAHELNSTCNVHATYFLIRGLTEIAHHTVVVDTTQKGTRVARGARDSVVPVLQHVRDSATQILEAAILRLRIRR